MITNSIFLKYSVEIKNIIFMYIMAFQVECNVVFTVQFKIACEICFSVTCPKKINNRFFLEMQRY